MSDLEFEVKEERMGNESEEHVCGKCRRVFEARDELERHLQEHVKVRAMTKVRKRKVVNRKFDNKCKFCEKSFQKPSQLVRHERIHTGEKPFKVMSMRYFLVDVEIARRLFFPV